jgi:hypothetical protein
MVGLPVSWGASWAAQVSAWHASRLVVSSGLHLHRILRLDEVTMLNATGLAAAPVGLAYLVGWTVGGTGLGVTAGTATGGATGTAAGFAWGSLGWCRHEAFVEPMFD